MRDDQHERNVIATVLTYAFVLLILGGGTAVTLALIQVTPENRSPAVADSRSIASLIAGAPQTHQLGDAVVVDTGGAELRITLDNVRAGAEGADCSGGSLHVVDATVQLVRGTALLEPAELTARTSGGSQLTTVATALEHPLEATTLTQNDVATGSVAFVLPPGETIVALSFAGGSEVATWAVPDDTSGPLEP
ncbi:hypothetical protein C7458_105112 [Williamsia muralis]|nr:hypothetical protein C7458_105112 [Williamsia marianensis]